MRMGLEARLLSKMGYDARIAVNMHNVLAGWADKLRQDGITVYDFDPPPFMEQWWWNRRRKYFKNGIFKRYNYAFWKIARVRNKARSITYTRRFLKRFRPHLIHVFVPWTVFEGTRLWIAHYFNIPTIMSIRNAYDYTEWLPWDSHHYREAFDSVKGIYAISKSALTNFMNIYGGFVRPETQIEIIHNSVDENKFNNNSAKRISARKHLKIPDNALVIGYVGRIEKQKRPHELLRIFDKLSCKIPDAYLVIIGTGPLENEIKNLARQQNLDSHVIFTGWQQNVENLIPAFDIAVTVSRNEGFGTTTIESMACGVPIVGTDIPGTRDILNNSKGGILVPRDDIKAAVDACSSLLLDSELRKKMGQSAREEAFKKFSEQNWEKNIIEFYEKIIYH